MTTEENKELIRNFVDEVWNNHNLDFITECVADNYVEHNPFGDFNGPDELRGFASMTMRGFPDFSAKVNEIIAEGNLVACYYTNSGTHEEEYLGVEPTGNKLNVDGCFMGRIENGALVEGWNQFDVMTLMTGLEIVTPDMLGSMEQMGAGGRGGARA